MAVAADPIVDELEAMACEYPESVELVRVYQALLPHLSSADLRVGPVEMTAQQAREKLRNGKPLLEGINLEFDEDAARSLMIALAQSIEDVLPNADDAGRAQEARQIRLQLQDGDLRPGMLLQNVASGDRSSVLALGQDRKLGAGLAWTLAQHALIPALNAWRQQLEPLIAAGWWAQGYCPICGSDATLGELQGNEGALHLRCRNCGADWRMSRTACVFCGNDDPNSLRVLFPDGQRDKWHVRTCQMCHRYLKVVSSFGPMPLELLPVRDVATLALDMVAREHGYVRSGDAGGT